MRRGRCDPGDGKHGVNDGHAHFLLADGDYCVEADPNDDGVFTSVDFTLANDPWETGEGVVDVEINEPNVLDVLVTINGTPVAAGVSVRLFAVDALDSATDCASLTEFTAAPTSSPQRHRSDRRSPLPGPG